jgi:hypothetical protein
VPAFEELVRPASSARGAGGGGARQRASRAAATGAPRPTRAPPWPATRRARRRLGDRQAGEVAELDEARLARVELGEAGEGLVEREHVDVRRPVAAAAPGASASDSVTWRAPPPRLAARRARAWSTSTRRMSCAATAKNCVRLSQRACRWSTSRRYASWTSAVAWSVARAASRGAPGAPAAQLRVHGRQQRVERRPVPGAPRVQERGDGRRVVGGASSAGASSAARRRRAHRSPARRRRRARGPDGPGGGTRGGPGRCRGAGRGRPAPATLGRAPGGGKCSRVRPPAARAGRVSGFARRFRAPR